MKLLNLQGFLITAYWFMTSVKRSTLILIMAALILPATTVEADPDISLSHDFGVVDVGTSSNPYTYGITNEGDADLVFGFVSLTGTDASDFSIEYDECSYETLLPLGICAVDVVFAPQSEGAKTARLSIPSNDPDTPILGVLLIGEGAALPTQEQLCSTLGNHRWLFGFDEDEYRFHGTQGEVVSLRLEAEPPEAGVGKRAKLTLRGRGFYERDRSTLPNEITATLPFSGEYSVTISEEFMYWTFSGTQYRGNYCVSVEASPETCQTFEPAYSVE